MRVSFSPALRLLLRFALVAVFFVATPQAPVRADAGPQEFACGSLDLSSASSADAAKAFDCFSSAFSHCEPATLVATGHDGSVATTWTFITVNGNDYGCSVSETVERGTGSSKTTDASLCRKVNRDKDSLRFTGCANAKDVALRIGSSVGATATP